MRIMLLTALLQLAAPPAQVEMNLPSVQISMADLGGTILMINMKHSIVIGKTAHESLKGTLGEKVRAEIYTDFVLGTDPRLLSEKYAKYDSPELKELILRYKSLLKPSAG